MWWRVGWLGDLPVQIIMLYSLLVDVQTDYLFVIYAHLKHVLGGILMTILHDSITFQTHVTMKKRLHKTRFAKQASRGWVRGCVDFETPGRLGLEPSNYVRHSHCKQAINKFSPSLSSY